MSSSPLITSEQQRLLLSTPERNQTLTRDGTESIELLIEGHARIAGRRIGQAIYQIRRWMTSFSILRLHRSKMGPKDKKMAPDV